MKLERLPHGVPGQLNIYELDKDSEITGRGRHNRIVVLGSPGTNQISAREDLRGLPASTDQQRRKVLNGHQRLHPRGARLVYLGAGPEFQSAFGASIEHHYTWERGARRRGHVATLQAIRAMFIAGSRWSGSRTPAWEGDDADLNGAIRTVVAVRSHTVIFVALDGVQVTMDLPRASKVIEAGPGVLRFEGRLRPELRFEYRLVDESPDAREVSP